MYKLISIICTFMVCVSCTTTEQRQKSNEGTMVQEKVLQQILDSTNLKGAILLYDHNAATYYSNDFEWSKKGFLPASTFKIPNSIIALETRVVENDSTLMKWDGIERNFKIWNQDLIFKKAFQYSCVPCYQEVARKIGVEQMKSYLKKLNYNGMEFDSTSIDSFWLVGDSRISPFDEIDFLKRLYGSELPIQKRNEAIIKKMMLIETNDQYKLSGKTGWASNADYNNGWFVGFLELSDNTIFFATNIEPAENFYMKNFPKARKAVTMKALNALDYL
ncbi:class D beta-lactamase [Flammeovirga sp. SJP92]|uniref:class D beta-lactamase n=1 Tax=Flammeovirga sp. SJP92 TaxID=1775430 RepID=UPI00078706B6|nr:class D beta-lactamase [Flammeovirga sp. SJP92]KXX68726.1 class D beta-lactamase [Flammeovirga sp. SJP92]